jgi:hypothetical protein
MKAVLKLEEGGLFCLSLILFNLLGYSWWLYAALILTPDISILGYLINQKAGAVIYNLFHHRGLAIILYALGIYTFNYALIVIGIIILGHSSLDRLFGFGLKYFDSFKHTHLDVLGGKAA